MDLGRVSTMTAAVAATMGRIKRLPSGPVRPPERRTRPAGRVAKRWP
jgi:hypothetical protein